MLGRQHGAVGEVRGEVEEHGRGAEGDEVGVVWAGLEAVECLPLLCATVASIIATAQHTARLGGGGGGE